MKNEVINTQPIFQPIKEVVKTIGLSEWYLRQALKAGTLPHIRSGSKIFVNVPLLLAELDKQSSHSLVKL